MIDCKFCSLLKDVKLINRESYRDSIAKGLKPRRHYYYVALFETPAGKRGGITHYRYKLNYCPECGKPLTRRKK